MTVAQAVLIFTLAQFVVTDTDTAIRSIGYLYTSRQVPERSRLQDQGSATRLTTILFLNHSRYNRWSGAGIRLDIQVIGEPMQSIDSIELNRDRDKMPGHP